MPAMAVENARNEPSSPLRRCTPTKRCALDLPPGRPPESQTASQAVAEVTAAAGVLLRTPPKRTAKWLLPTPRARAPPRPPTRRIQVTIRRKQRMLAQPGKALDTRHARTGDATKQVPL